VDLIPGDIEYLWTVVAKISPLQKIKPLEVLNQEAMAMAIDTLTLEQYHQICYWNLSQRRVLYCSASATVNLNTRITCPSGDRLEDSVEIALLPDAQLCLGKWAATDRATGEVMEGGWTRYYDFILAAW
jgi:hypothetical protein